jgi:small subunit ribosomal protein S9
LSTSQYLGTGRRKTSTARVFLRPGTGVFTVNDKNIETYFFDEVHRMIAKQPLQISDTISKFDVVVSVAGGGMRGQAGAVQHGIARALVDYSAELRQILKKAGFLTRDPNEGAQKNTDSLERESASSSQSGSGSCRQQGSPPCRRCLFRAGLNPAGATYTGGLFGVYHNERASGGGCSFRTPDETLESKDEAVHLWRA